MILTRSPPKPGGGGYVGLPIVPGHARKQGRIAMGWNACDLHLASCACPGGGMGKPTWATITPSRNDRIPELHRSHHHRLRDADPEVQTQRLEEKMNIITVLFPHFPRSP